MTDHAKRYTVYFGHASHCGIGDYVLFTDYEAKCADYERLRDALEKTRFISVNERLPELDKIVEVIVPAQKCAWLSHALRYMDDGVWLWSFVTEDHICMNAEHIPDTEDAEWEPTHWRELPDISPYVAPAAGSLEEADAPKAARKDKESD